MIRRRQFTHAGLLLPLTAALSSQVLSSQALAAKAQGDPSPSSRKILLDTDIGSDIDDAVALAYLLRQPRCELLGITTVTGDAQGRARLAAALCEAASVETPIYPGEETPLFVDSMQTDAPQTRRLKSREATFPNHAAIEFLRDTVHAHPHEVTLLAVGPLTNIATLFARYPETPALLAELVIMGGKFSDYPTPWGPTEWNVIVDPHAARQVFAAAVPKITATGLDITWQVSMSPEEVKARFREDPLLEIVLDWSKVWFEERELLHFHDPLTAATLFNPSLCRFQSGDVYVDLESKPIPGVTSFRENPASTIQVATNVDSDAFFKEYFSVFHQ
ncbi:nucleoside hydrolase [Congregibacter litoralis]|uniref:Inosine-uridine nucleoside N-ribohydrolase n=1 Tax=Congregibacter litoralis KT71 TaxID=314285 RepID=A4AB77_9GAMM|nr:nucleoside hydrolase [Congregibacter litoralis]EAQ96631.2 Inosine-uridine nucleoside N-ribohydrolase [Congregibacter litoralis KT71]